MGVLLKFDILESIKNCYLLEITLAQDDPVFLVISSPCISTKNKFFEYLRREEGRGQGGGILSFSAIINKSFLYKFFMTQIMKISTNCEREF